MLRALSSLSFERLRSFGVSLSWAATYGGMAFGVSLSWGPPAEEFGSWLSGRVGHFGLSFERLRSFGVSLSWGPPSEEWRSACRCRGGHLQRNLVLGYLVGSATSG
jgi:hypothetical protein